jgi:hypothetical protein
MGLQLCAFIIELENYLLNGPNQWKLIFESNLAGYEVDMEACKHTCTYFVCKDECHIWRSSLIQSYR